MTGLLRTFAGGAATGEAPLSAEVPQLAFMVATPSLQPGQARIRAFARRTMGVPSGKGTALSGSAADASVSLLTVPDFLPAGR